MGRRVRTWAVAGVVALVALAGWPFAPPAEASGIVTHSWMAAEAIPLVSDPALRAVLQANARDVEGGAHFPDSGYAAGVVGQVNFGEEAHWPRWHLTVADDIAEDCPNLTATSGACARRIALLFGAVGHGMGDEVWDWLFEPQAPDRGESYVPPALAGSFSNTGLEMQMDLIAIGDYDRSTSPLPSLPAPAQLVDAFATVDHDPTVQDDDLQAGFVAISVARNAERTLTANHRASITRNMRWTSSHLVTAPGGIRFAARAIAGAWDNLWDRMQGEDPATQVAATYPADGETGVPTTGWDRAEFLPGSAPDRGGAENRITAVLDASLPFEPLASTPGDIDEQLPPGAMTLTRVDGEVPVPLRAGYPRQVPYGAESGEHVIDLQPDGNLEACTEYRVDVTGALLDLDEQPVTPHSWTFTTDGCAGTVRRPDLSAKRGATGALVGDDVYTPGGVRQTRSLRTAAGRTATFFVRLENDGNEDDRLRVTGQGTVPRFTVRYLDGSRDVTAAVRAGTFRTPVLGPGGARTLRVDITLAPGTPAGAQVTRLVTARSTNAPAVVDGVQLSVRRTSARLARQAEVAPAPELSDAELAEAYRSLQVCLLD